MTNFSRGICAHCDQLFALSAPGIEQRFCSASCRREYLAARIERTVASVERTIAEMDRAATCIRGEVAKLEAEIARLDTPRAA